MCLSTVMTRQGRTICKNVASVTEKDGPLAFTAILVIPTVVPGAIEKIDLLENIITIREK